MYSYAVPPPGYVGYEYSTSATYSISLPDGSRYTDSHSYYSAQCRSPRTGPQRRHSRQASSSISISSASRHTSPFRRAESLTVAANAKHQSRDAASAKPKTILPREASLDYTETEEAAKTHLVAQEKPQRFSNASNQTIKHYASMDCEPLKYTYPEPNSKGSIHPKRTSKVNETTAKSKKSERAVGTGIPPGYSFKNWDPTEQPILLLGSVFDANSLGKWVYDWTVSEHWPMASVSDLVGELWLHLTQVAASRTNRTKAADRLRVTSISSMLDKVIGSATGARKQRRLLYIPSPTNLMRMLCFGSLLHGASALPIPIDATDESSSSSPGWPGGPGFPSISGWPSPLLGLMFAGAITASSKPYNTSRMPGVMALVFNYLSLVASGDATTPPAVMWTLKGLAAYFVVFYGDVTFRNNKMGQGYFALLILSGLLMDYSVAQILLAGQTEATLRDELFRFSLPTFSLSLCLCAYHARYEQRAAESLARAKGEERLLIEQRLRLENAVCRVGDTQPAQAAS